MPLTIFRRHSAVCPHASKGRAFIKCNCPLWADGYHEGKRTLFQSLRTRDLARARKKAVALESPDSRSYKPVHKAIEDFLEHCTSNGLGSETFRKYTNSLNKLKAFCDTQDIDYIHEVTTPVLDKFRASRKIAPITATKELQLLRQFSEFCFGRRWMDENPAKRISSPRNLQPNDVEPYSAEDIRAILDACDAFGRSDYERLRARAMILCFRYTALRLGDVAMMARDRVRKVGDSWRIFLRTEKNGKPIFLAVPDELVDALRKAPTPRRTVGESKHFFWNNRSKPRSMKKNADDTLRAVFRKSDVTNAHAHRFRHTLATEMLGMGASFEEVADVLGNSPAVVRKHYAKWSNERQSRIDDLLKQVHSSASYVPQKLVVMGKKL